MTIQKHLDTLRSQISACDLTAFGDLSSTLILRSSSEEPCHREVLDDLIQRAADGFSLAEAAPAPEISEPSTFGHAVVMFQDGKSFVFAREGKDPDEVTCAVLSAAEDTVAALDLVRNCARATGSDDL